LFGFSFSQFSHIGKFSHQLAAATVLDRESDKSTKWIKGQYIFRKSHLCCGRHVSVMLWNRNVGWLLYHQGGKLWVNQLHWCSCSL